MQSIKTAAYTNTGDVPNGKKEEASGTTTRRAIMISGRQIIPGLMQSTLTKADTLGTKATVRFREVSASERVQVTRYPNLQTETRAHSQCTMIT